MTEASGPAPRRTGARELARRAMREQVSAMAFGLFAERGYEETTVDDICEVAGISRSTFFRYFPSKEDALFGEVAAFGGKLLDALRARPDDEPPWTALRRALNPLIESYEAGPERSLRLARLITTTPALAAHQHEKTANWHALLEPEVGRRLGGDPGDTPDPRPAALVAATLACLDAAVQAWAAGDATTPLSRIVDRAMASVGR